MTEEKCWACNSIIDEITLFNGEEKHFCSEGCVRKYELIQTFYKFVNILIKKYQYIDQDFIISWLVPKCISTRKRVKSLVEELILRGYYRRDKYGILYPSNKIIELPREY